MQALVAGSRRGLGLVVNRVSRLSVFFPLVCSSFFFFFFFFLHLCAVRMFPSPASFPTPYCHYHHRCQSVTLKSSSPHPKPASTTTRTNFILVKGNRGSLVLHLACPSTRLLGSTFICPQNYERSLPCPANHHRCAGSLGQNRRAGQGKRLPTRARGFCVARSLVRKPRASVGILRDQRDEKGSYFQGQDSG